MMMESDVKEWRRGIKVLASVLGTVHSVLFSIIDQSAPM